MRTLFTMLIVFGCVLPSTAEEIAMQATTIDGMSIVLTAPSEIPDAAVRPYSAERDPQACAVQVTFRNESGHPIKAPLDEIGNGLVSVYSVEGTGEPLIDNEIPPPPRDGSVISLAPGKSHVVRMSFAYPQPLMPDRLWKTVVVKFCVRWRENWLRAANYAPGTVQWNVSFDVCADVRITGLGSPLTH